MPLSAPLDRKCRNARFDGNLRNCKGISRAFLSQMHIYKVFARQICFVCRYLFHIHKAKNNKTEKYIYECSARKNFTKCNTTRGIITVRIVLFLIHFAFGGRQWYICVCVCPFHRFECSRYAKHTHTLPAPYCFSS